MMTPWQFAESLEGRDVNPLVIGANVGPPSAFGGFFDPDYLGAVGGWVNFAYFQNAGIFNVPNPNNDLPNATPSTAPPNPPQDGHDGGDYGKGGPVKPAPAAPGKPKPLA